MNVLASPRAHRLFFRQGESHHHDFVRAGGSPGYVVRRWRTLSMLAVSALLALAVAACSPLVPPDGTPLEVEPTPAAQEETEVEMVEVAEMPPTLPTISTGETYRGLPVGFTDDGRLFRGDPNAPLTMIEYSDYQCPFCNRYFVQTEPALDEAYVRSGELLVIFHDFPLEQLHPIAPLIHAANLCVADQGSAATAWQMRSETFRSVEEWGSATDPLAVMARLAQEVGADADAMVACIEADTFGAVVAERVGQAIDEGFTGTPSFQLIRPQDGSVFQLVGAQPYDEFAGLINALLAGQTPQTAQAGAQPDDSPPLWATEEGLAPDPARSGYTMGGDLYRGNPDAPVTIVEFSDFQCPFCRRHVEETQPTLDELYVDTGQVFWVFKHFPLNIHPQAPLAGAAAECAADQGQFWEMHHLLFETVNQWAVNDPAPVLVELAGELDLNLDEFEACLDAGEALARVESDLTDGAPFVRGTPTFIILYNDQGSIVPGALPLETFVEVLDEILAEVQ